MQAACAQYCAPARVVDGDTFHFQRGAELVKVRVAGFDAPERGQAYGRVATAKLKELTQAGADCDCFKTDKYGRSVCRVRVGGHNVATTMLYEGLGCIDSRFVGEDSATDRQANAEALRAAQAARRGMWVDDAPVCGKEFRDSKRAKR
jgi:endonuclease YncB( thermonuclease family)